MAGDGPGATTRRRWWHRGPFSRPAVRLSVGSVLVCLFVFYVALPLLASHRAEVAALAHIHPAYLAAGVVLEVAALAAYAQLTHAVLPHGGPRRLRLFRINLATLSLSHVAPGGTAPAAALGYRLLVQSGVSAPDAGFALGTQGIGSAVVLNVLFWFSLVGFLATHGFHAPAGPHAAGSTGPALLTMAAGVGGVLVVVFAGLAVLVTRGPPGVRRAVHRLCARLTPVDPSRLVGFFEGLAHRCRDLVADRSLTRRAVGWAAANWLLDAASLWVFVAAFGHLLSPIDLLCAYGLANILAAVPLTPAGLGVVELVLVSMITGFGPTAAQALSGVLAYRAVNFWLPIPIGGMAYASLELERRRRPGRRRASRAAGEAEGRGGVVAGGATSTVPFRLRSAERSVASAGLPGRAASPGRPSAGRVPQPASRQPASRQPASRHPAAGACPDPGSCIPATSDSIDRTPVRAGA